MIMVLSHLSLGLLTLESSSYSFTQNKSSDETPAAPIAGGETHHPHVEVPRRKKIDLLGSNHHRRGRIPSAHLVGRR